MRKTELSMETKQMILEDYNNPNIKAHDVHKKHGISQHVMQAVVLELGGNCVDPKGLVQAKMGIRFCGARSILSFMAGQAR